jgi:DnaK suppressor protein
MEIAMMHLTDAQLGTLKRILDEREHAAQFQIRSEASQRADEPYATLTGEVSDTGDEATADLIVDIDNAMMSLQLTQLQDISAARERIKHGRYGICINCELEIEYDRLLAYPTAKRCAACQSLHEKTFSTQIHSSL